MSQDKQIPSDELTSAIYLIRRQVRNLADAKAALTKAQEEYAKVEKLFEESKKRAAPALAAAHPSGIVVTGDLMLRVTTTSGVPRGVDVTEVLNLGVNWVVAPEPASTIAPPYASGIVRQHVRDNQPLPLAVTNGQ